MVVDFLFIVLSGEVGKGRRRGREKGGRGGEKGGREGESEEREEGERGERRGETKRVGEERNVRCAHLKCDILVSLIQHLLLEPQAIVHVWDHEGAPGARPRVQAGTPVTKPTSASLQEESAVLLVLLRSVIPRVGVVTGWGLIIIWGNRIMPWLRK
jgi:hypothetical protein